MRFEYFEFAALAALNEHPLRPTSSIILTTVFMNSKKKWTATSKLQPLKSNNSNVDKRNDRKLRQLPNNN